MAEEVIETYAYLEVGLADASIVILSRRHKVLDLLTLDERYSAPSAARPTSPSGSYPRTAMWGSVLDSH